MGAIELAPHGVNSVVCSTFATWVNRDSHVWPLAIVLILLDGFLGWLSRLGVT